MAHVGLRGELAGSGPVPAAPPAPELPPRLADPAIPPDAPAPAVPGPPALPARPAEPTEPPGAAPAPPVDPVAPDVPPPPPAPAIPGVPPRDVDPPFPAPPVAEPLPPQPSRARITTRDKEVFSSTGKEHLPMRETRCSSEPAVAPRLGRPQQHRRPERAIHHLADERPRQGGGRQTWFAQRPERGIRGRRGQRSTRCSAHGHDSQHFPWPGSRPRRPGHPARSRRAVPRSRPHRCPPRWGPRSR